MPDTLLRTGEAGRRYGADSLRDLRDGGDMFDMAEAGGVLSGRRLVLSMTERTSKALYIDGREEGDATL